MRVSLPGVTGTTIVAPILPPVPAYTSTQVVKLGVAPALTLLIAPTKQLVWNAGLPPLAARRRTPMDRASSAPKVLAGKASTEKPLPCGLDTREYAVKGAPRDSVSRMYTKPNCDPLARPA